MSFIRAFLISLVVFIALNFVFSLISLVILYGGDTFTEIENQPLEIINMLFGSILYSPGTLGTSIAKTSINEALETAEVTAIMIRYIGMFVAPIIAAILAGRFGDSKVNSFGGWFLAAIITMVVWIILFFIENDYTTSILPELISSLEDEILLSSIIIAGAVNGVFYGGIAVLTVQSDVY